MMLCVEHLVRIVLLCHLMVRLEDTLILVVMVFLTNSLHLLDFLIAGLALVLGIFTGVRRSTLANHTTELSSCLLLLLLLLLLLISLLLISLVLVIDRLLVCLLWLTLSLHIALLLWPTQRLMLLLMSVCLAAQSCSHWTIIYWVSLTTWLRVCLLNTSLVVTDLLPINIRLVQFITNTYTHLLNVLLLLNATLIIINCMMWVRIILYRLNVLQLAWHVLCLADHATGATITSATCSLVVSLTTRSILL